MLPKNLCCVAHHSTALRRVQFAQKLVYKPVTADQVRQSILNRHVGERMWLLLVFQCPCLYLSELVDNAVRANDLKSYCREEHLLVSGSKAVLLTRVRDHINNMVVLSS